MNDWMDFGTDFPPAYRDAIRARVFAWRISHNLEDDAFKMKLYRVSDVQFNLWIASPDGKAPTDQTVLFSASAAQSVEEFLEVEYEAWRSRAR